MLEYFYNFQFCICSPNTAIGCQKSNKRVVLLLISNLGFLSKVVEKVVDARLAEHVKPKGTEMTDYVEKVAAYVFMLETV